MRRRNNHSKRRNHSSYGYGFLARVQKGFGIFFAMICLFAFAFTINFLWLVGLGLSLWMIYSGSKKEYNFQRSGGYIIYNN